MYLNIAFCFLIVLKFSHLNSAFSFNSIFLFPLIYNFSTHFFLINLGSKTNDLTFLNPFWTLHFISTSSSLVTFLTVHLISEEGNEKGILNVNSSVISSEKVPLTLNLPVSAQLDKLKLVTSKIGGIFSLFSAIEKFNTFPKLS